MSKPLFKIEGMEQLEASVNRLQNTDAEVARIAKQCGQVLYTSIAYKTPVRTGALRASLSAETEENGLGVDIIVGTAQTYAAAVEFGRNGRPGHSYLRAGLTEAQPVIEQIIRTGLTAGVFEQ